MTKSPTTHNGLIGTLDLTYRFSESADFRINSSGCHFCPRSISSNAIGLQISSAVPSSTLGVRMVRHKVRKNGSHDSKRKSIGYPKYLFWYRGQPIAHSTRDSNSKARPANKARQLFLTTIEKKAKEHSPLGFY